MRRAWNCSINCKALQSAKVYYHIGLWKTPTTDLKMLIYMCTHLYSSGFLLTGACVCGHTCNSEFYLLKSLWSFCICVCLHVKCVCVLLSHCLGYRDFIQRGFKNAEQMIMSSSQIGSFSCFFSTAGARFWPNQDGTMPWPIQPQCSPGLCAPAGEGRRVK
jgi:hypothetical protein